MEDTPHMALVSDIAANHVETLYRDGTHTLPALTDLLEICQAAVLYDTLAVSPTARRRSWLLREFDFVYTPELSVSERSSDVPSGPPPSSDGNAIVIGHDDERGLFSASIYGELLLAMAFAESFGADAVLASLVNPDGLPPYRDRGRHFYAKLPALMLGLQHQRGLIEYENDEARRSLDGVFAPLIGRYTQYARHVLRLQNGWRVGVVSSVLEQPIVSSVVVDGAIARAEPAAAGPREQLVQQLDRALLSAPARGDFFERWRFPPIGMLVLGTAASLADVPRVVGRMRDEFAPLRRAVTDAESRLGALARASAGFSVRAEEAARDRENLDRELREAYVAFAEHVEQRRTWGRRTELVFNSFGYALQVATGLGLTSVGMVVEAIGLKRMAMMQRVPGLLRLASLVRHSDSTLVTEVAERLLGASPGLAMQADVLRMAYDHAETYVTHGGEAPPPRPGISVAAADEDEDDEPVEFSDRQVWMELNRNEPLRQMLMLST